MKCFFTFFLCGLILSTSVAILHAQDSSNGLPGWLSPAAVGLDLDFNAPVTTTSDLRINATASQADGKVIIGGQFSIGGDTPRNSVARLDEQGNIDPSFNNGVGTGGLTQVVYALAVQPDGKILVGGQFDQFNGQTARSFVRLNPDGSLDTAFLRGDTFGAVRTIVLQPDGKILVGGEFFKINGTSRNRIARLNLDGTFDSSFDLGGTGPSNPVYALARQPDGKVIVGGSFGSYNNDPNIRNFLRLNADGSLDNTFNNTSGVGRVYSLVALPDEKIVIGGFFLAYNGTLRDSIARVSSSGVLDTSFNASASGDVLSMILQDDGKILLGGFFGQINGIPTGPFTRINADGTHDASFIGSVNYRVSSIHIQPHNGKIIAGGEFWAANSAPRSGLARFESDGGLDAGFDPVIGSPGSVNAIAAYSDGNVLIGGIFNNVGGFRRNRLARVSAIGSVDPSFDTGTGANNEIRAIGIQPDGKILVGGDFNEFNGTSQSSIARLNPGGSIDNSFNLPGGISFRVRSIKVLQSGKIAVGGGFVSVGGTARDHIARLNADGSLDASFNAAADSDVYDIAEQADGKIIIVGSFGRVNNTPQVGVARLNPDGTLDEGFNIGAGAGGQVFSVDLDPDGKIVIGGFFTAFDNIQRKYVARLNPDGNVDTTFDPGSGAGFTVFSVACQPNGMVIVAGDFETFDGQIRRGIVRLKANGLVDNSFNPIITRNGYNRPTLLEALIVPDPNDENRGKLFMGGRFTSVNGFSRIGLARMTLNFNPARSPFDFDGDDKTDIGIFRPGAAEWWYSRSSDNQVLAAQFGASTDKIVPGDFTGDGKADIAFWRPSTGFWYVLRSEDGSFFSFPFGTNGDVPVPADYDADGKTDAAVFRPSTNTWYILQSGGGGVLISQFGAAGDLPVVADYDGDGKADIAIFRPSVGEWWIARSTASIAAFQFGAGTDKPVQGDYTGDGKADAAFWRPSTGFWYILRSEDFSYFSFPFGQNGDIPSPGDYDGDGKFDASVFRPSSSTWFVNRTTAGVLITQFGATGDQPIPNAFVP